MSIEKAIPVFGALTDDIDHVLLTAEELDTIVKRVGCEITNKFSVETGNTGRKLLAVCILKGSLVFVADLIREIKLPLEVSFLRATSYGSGTVSSGVVEISLAIDEKDLIGADVLVVEDILDSGHTLSNILKYLAGKGAHSVSLCVLLNKPSRRKTEVTIDYEGKQIPDEFVVGYGLDYNEKYRNLPYIGVLKKELYS